jgi:hypothetical protein
LATKSQRMQEILAQIDPSQPTRMHGSMPEPPTDRPPEPPAHEVRQQDEPKDIDPFELVKEQYRVNVMDMLKWSISSDPDQESVKRERSHSYLLFDNYYERVMVTGIKKLHLELQNGDEQAVFAWFYRKSYGFGYSVCPMGQRELMKKLMWSKERVKNHLDSLIEKGHITPLEEFPPFKNHRAQIYQVAFPRQLLEQKIEQLKNEKLKEQMRADVARMFRG